MNCIIPGLNLKVFARALQALAKVGDDLYMEASKEKLCLIALNLRKTVCVRYYLLESYFSSYEIDENELSEHTESIFCKIHMKIFLPLFKGVHLDKKLEFVKLEYENNNDLIIVKMKYKCDDIVMVHKLRLMEAESLTIGVCSDLGSSNIITTSSLYSQLLNTFSTSDDEITLEISRDKVLVRNYCVGAPLRPKSVRSQVNLNGSEFTVFQIGDETTINFSLKPFRTAIQFAEAFNLNIGLNFEKGGKPLAIVMKNPAFEVNFIVATLNPYSDAQSTITASSIPAKITQLNKDIGNITTEDREALENENWDDMEIDTNKIPLETCSMNTKKGSFHEIVTKAKQKIRNATTSKLGTESSTGSFSKKQGDKRNKIFELPLKSQLNEDVDDIIPLSPESPKTKKAKLVFGRCFESTFSRKNLGKILAPNSDSE